MKCEYAAGRHGYYGWTGRAPGVPGPAGYRMRRGIATGPDKKSAAAALRKLGHSARLAGRAPPREGLARLL